MELKLDVKTLIIGIAIGVIATAVIGAGYGNADKTDFGIAIPSATGEGSALVRTADDVLYIVNAKNAMAVRVLLASVRAETSDRRDGRNRPFSLTIPAQPQEKGNY